MLISREVIVNAIFKFTEDGMSPMQFLVQLLLAFPIFHVCAANQLNYHNIGTTNIS